MKLIITLAFCFVCFLSYAQEDNTSIHFPREQLVHPKCNEDKNPSECLLNLIKKNTETIILKAIKRIKKDTLRVHYSFQINDNNEIDKTSMRTFSNDKKFFKSFKTNLEQVIKAQPKFTVLNKKNKKYFTSHSFNFSFKIDKKNNTAVFVPTLSKRKYEGGVIEEIPVYNGCEGSYQELRKCFNEKMLTHIRSNFRYPKQAQKDKMQGRVNVIFKIDEEGNVSDIKTRGPHRILEKEAKRIISLLPKVKPGIIDGKPVKVPFAVPITFRLSR